ncbi:MAG TPA: hypothetical protein VF638_01610, partial [Sphingomonas sp.]
TIAESALVRLFFAVAHERAAVHNDCAFQASSPKTFTAGLVPAFFCAATCCMANMQSSPSS